MEDLENAVSVSVLYDEEQEEPMFTDFLSLEQLILNKAGLYYDNTN